MLVSGFLLRLDYFELVPLYATLLIGDLGGDILWYTVGYFGARPLLEKYGGFLSVSREAIGKLEALFARYQNRILFISKITMGFGFALVTLATAGMVRVPFKKYLLFNFTGGFIWTAFLISIGYFFGNLYLVIHEGLRFAFVIFLVVLFTTTAFGFGHFMRQKLFRNGS